MPPALPAAVLLFVLAVPVGVPFGEARVDGRRAGAATIEVEIVVEAPPGSVVVAHLVPPGEAGTTVALREREPGVFGAFAETRAADLSVVFEVVGPDPALSEPRRLTELGLPADVLAGDRATSPGPRLELLAVGLAAALAALALIGVVRRARGDPPRSPPT